MLVHRMRDWKLQLLDGIDSARNRNNITRGHHWIRLVTSLETILLEYSIPLSAFRLAKSRRIRRVATATKHCIRLNTSRTREIFVAYIQKAETSRKKLSSSCARTWESWQTRE